ncbi:MAG: 50S ribosomal protein L19 [Patescibacteria group bacterium]
MTDNQEKTPDIRPGYEIKVHQKIKEGNKERIQIFEGLVMAIRGRGQGRTFMVRKISEGIGVEKIFPIFSPTIKKIEVVRKFKVNKAKLYYLRSSKAKKLKEIR